MYRYTSYYEEEYNTTEIELGSNLICFLWIKMRAAIAKRVANTFYHFNADSVRAV